ncbi:antibiotic biosynthesis monooxygenase [Streptomyces sp. NPDC005322]|uniref:antibiotic biosynthesis monooxygenase n=1 Tax=Streptomyces sp. NPDC005322 TaxID=3157032 RepID=UPI0033BAD68D
MAGRTDNSVVIDAPMELVWDMTNDVSHWAELFAEYATSEVLAVEGNTVRFRLTTQPDEDGKQHSWVSERTADPKSRTVSARRLDSAMFEYMNIRWEYTADPRGIRMRWIQEFTMKPSAPVDDRGAEVYLNRQTVKEMARIKKLVEKAARADGGRAGLAEGKEGMTDTSAASGKRGPVFRVLLRAEIAEGKEKEFEEAWRGIGEVITGQPANLGQWLMRSHDEPGVYYIISDWIDEERFRAFERSEAHVGHRSKLQPFRTKGSMVTTDVVAEMVKAGAR